MLRYIDHGLWGIVMRMLEDEGPAVSLEAMGVSWPRSLKRRLGPTFLGFAFLRALITLGAFGWLLFAPLPSLERQAGLLLLLLFFVYSLLLYILLLQWPGIKRWNLLVLGLDLGFAFFLVRWTGGIGSEFSLGFYLITALQAFHYGLVRGVGVALVSSLLYLGSVWPLLEASHWADYVLRTSFLWLIAISLGLLSEREWHKRQAMEELNRELKARGEQLERAYQELKGAQEHLIRSEKLAALGTLSAGLAHEINNPIGIISSRVELMLLEAKERALPKQVQEDLKVIGKHAARVARIAHGLLSFAKQASWEFIPLDLNQLVEEVLLLTEKQLSKERITLEKRLSPGLPKILGSPNHLEQVLLNLLTNAREAMPQGGRLVVESRKGQDGYVQLLVTDTGVGIPEEARPRIFDPFFTTKKKGTGLGLSISYGIIQGHGGTIEVDSQVGKGSTFIVTLPSAKGASRGKRND